MCHCAKFFVRKTARLSHADSVPNSVPQTCRLQHTQRSFFYPFAVLESSKWLYRFGLSW